MSSSQQCYIPHSLFAVYFLKEAPNLVDCRLGKALDFWASGASPASSFRNDLEEGLDRIFLVGIIFVTLITLTATALCIFGAGGVSCHSITDRECFNSQLQLSENYENVFVGKL